MTINAQGPAEPRPRATPVNREVRDHYLSLLHRVLTRYEMERRTPYSPIARVMAPLALRPVIKAAHKILRSRSPWVVTVRRRDAGFRSEGRDWRRSAETMVGVKRFDSLRGCLVQILAGQVPGDILEAVVWRGGACTFWAAYFRRTGQLSASPVWLTPSRACPRRTLARVDPTRVRSSVHLTSGGSRARRPCRRLESSSAPYCL